MRKLVVFNLLTLDGFLCGKNGDISWHNVDLEFQEMVIETSHSGNTLLFGRITYELMANYWTSPEALESDPIVAEGMNSADKIVFSKSMRKAEWVNTRLINTDLLGEVIKLKHLSGKDLVILGSGEIVSQLTAANLIDEYKIMLNPVIIGEGKTMFETVRNKQLLKLLHTRTFANGNILLTYVPL